MKFLVINLLFFIISGCGKSPEGTPANLEHFKVVDIQLAGITDLSQNRLFPEFSKRYKLSATLMDLSTALPVPNEEFILSLGEEGRIVVTSDASGRIFWNEIIHFNILSGKKRIFIDRKISSRSHSKEENIRFTIYPHASILNEEVSEFLLLDPDEKPDEEYITKLRAREIVKKTFPLQLMDSHLNLTYLGPKEAGGSYRFHLETQLAVALKNKNNIDVDLIIKEGLIDLQLYFFEDYNDEAQNNSILAKYIENVKIINSTVSVNFSETLSLSSHSANVYVGIRVIPKLINNQVRDFHGLYNLGKIQSIAGSHHLLFERNYNSRFSDFSLLVRKIKPLFIKHPKNINFNKLDLQYDMIEDGETPTKRSIIYRSSTCASDLFNGQKLAFENFKIKKTTGETISTTSDGDGCIFWNERIEHKYYMAERFFRRTNIITHISSNISKTLVSYINPWTILTIGRDQLEMDEDTLTRIAAREEVHSRLFLEEYSYETIGVTYHIDEFMTLFVRKNILLDLEFQVTRYSSLTDGINAKEDIRDGVYLLKIAFEKSYIDTRKTLVEIDQHKESLTLKNSMTRKPLEYIYIVNKLVRVWNGHIITPVELSIHDLRLMTIRSNFLLQLQTIEQDHLELSKNFNIEELRTDRVIKQIEKNFPGKTPSLDLLADNDSGLPTLTFVGPMILLEKEGGADVRPTDAINICETDDCNFLEKDNQELQKRIYPYDKKYHEHIYHLVGKSVDDLLTEKILLDLKYRNQKVVESLFQNYLETFGLNLVSNTEDELFTIAKDENEIHCPHLYVEPCLKKTKDRVIPAHHFISQLNKNAKDKKIQSIKDFNFSGEEQEYHLGNKLCYMLIDKLNITLHENSETSDIYSNSDRELVTRTLKKVCDENHTFSFHQIIRTDGIRQFHFLGGKTVNFDLGSIKSIEFSDAFESGASPEFNPLGLTSFIPWVGDIISGTTSYTLAAIRKQEYAYNESSEITSTTYLAMQRATFEINFKNPKVCLEAKLKRKYATVLSEELSKYNNSSLTYDIKALNEGWVICDIYDSEEVKNRFFRENYYYFAQHFTEGHMLDDGSLLNHPWLLGLRGDRGYFHFVYLLGVKPTAEKRDLGLVSEFFKWVTSPFQINPENLAPAFTENNLAEVPLDQISRAFENIPPSFPGIYTVLPEKKEFPYD